MVAAISQPQPSSNSSTPRHPLLPTEKDHKQNNVPPPSCLKKPRGKLVPSRYLSSSPSSSSTTSTSTSSSSTSSFNSPFTKRYPSPILSRPTSPSYLLSSSSVGGPKRSQSVDRRRGEPKQCNGGQISDASRMLITSTRSLSVSFQGEAFSLPVSKEKVASNGGRRPTPERRRPSMPQGENFKPIDQHRRWPGRSREVNNNFLSRSLNYGGGVGVKALDRENSLLVDEDRRLSLDLGNARRNPDANLLVESSFSAGDLTASDSDSVSSGSTSGAGQEFGNKGVNGARGISVSARFWQETNSRLRKLQDPGSPLSPGSRMGAPSKGIRSKNFASDGPLASPKTAAASPVRGATRPASPSKLWASTVSPPLRSLSSPSRTRPFSGNTGAMPSILSFSVDLRRGKIGEDKIADAHTLRLLYNRYVQWKFVNARADTTFMVQRLSAEKNLWNAWVKISELRHSVILKRIKLLLLRQKLKLRSILKGQILYLEEWSLLDQDHLSSLDGATEALKASTLRLPVVGKAIADVQSLKDSIGSAVNILQAMASSICALSTKVEEMNALMAELVNVTVNERAFLEQCNDFLSKLAALQVTYCSLRTHVTQIHRPRLPTA